MKNLLITIVNVLLLVSSAHSITSFELIDQKFSQGELTKPDAIYYKILAIKEPSLLPPDLRGAQPLKCGTGFVQWLKREENNLPFELKPVVRWAFDRPSLPLTYDTPGGHFKIHYTRTGIDAVPDTAFVRQLGEYLDRVWAFEIDTLGYPAPPSDRGLGGDNRYDVYIRSIDAYGVTWQESEGPEPWDDYISYIEINNDFSAFPPNTDPDGHTSGALKVTSAHEFFHAIQMGINADTDGWWMEMTAVWMEETAYDTVNDYYNYLRDFFGSPEVSLIAYDGSHEYGAGLFPLYLSTKWGVNIIRSIWSNCKWHSAFEAISLTLDSIGTTIDEAVLEFFVWNYFTSIRDDGHHYPEGSSYPGVRFESVHATYPASGSSRHQPQGLGTNYIMFRPGSATGTLHISANCIPGVKWGLSFLRLQSSGESSFSTIILPSGGTTSFNVSPVERYSTIVVILSPLGGSSTSTYNFSYSAILTGELYPPPINLRASSGYDHMVPLMWQPRSGFLPTRYSVYRKLAGESNFIRIAATPETSYNDSSVENGRTYVYAVTAIYDTIESVFSDTVWAIPGGGVVIDSVWLRRDNDDPEAYISDISPGEIVGIRIVPDDFSYSYRLLKVSFLLYNFASVAGESVRVKVYSVNPSLNVGELIYQSSPFWVRTFYPSGWCIYDLSSARIRIPSPNGVIVGVEFLSGTSGTIPSILVDTQDTIPRNINFYYSDGRWIEHYSFWRNPYITGYNMIRILAERSTTGIENDNVFTKKPRSVTIERIFPNPFNSLVAIELNLSVEEKNLEVSIFDINGRLIRKLLCQKLRGETKTLVYWDARNDKGFTVPTGVYFVRASGESGVAVKRIIYIR